jgi:hypothetical protein
MKMMSVFFVAMADSSSMGLQVDKIVHVWQVEAHVAA